MRPTAAFMPSNNKAWGIRVWVSGRLWHLDILLLSAPLPKAALLE